MPVNVTVPLLIAPPITVDGTRDRLLRIGGLIVSDAVTLTPGCFAVIVTVKATATGLVAMLKDALFLPATIWIDVGT